MTALAVRLGRLSLRNPVMVASGTFGYALEMEGLVDFSTLGAIVPKTVTRHPRPGNAPPRTVETACGMLNAIGLDNDGIDYFLAHHVPYLAKLPTAIIANIAGKTLDEFPEMAGMLAGVPGLAAVELNLSCPNVAGGMDFAVDPEKVRNIVSRCRGACPHPILAKLTPNVTNIVDIARAATEGGADALTIANTFLGIAIHWRKKRPILGNGMGGLSGPAIKPIVLRMVYQVAKENLAPIVAVGGIANIDDVMEFLVAGASAVQVGTANFYDPTAAPRIVAALPAAVAELGATQVTEVIGSMHR
jgi:dihydroorotate dehydrogenase (NAD+) catalytic subunit